MQRIMTVLLACVLLSGCDDTVLAPGEVLPVVTVRDATDGPTSLMNVTVSNIGYGRFSYGGCALLIERAEREGWAPIPEYRERVCLLFLAGLPAGEARTFAVPRPTEVGLYRVRFVVRHREQDIGVLSSPFVIGTGIGI